MYNVDMDYVVIISFLAGGALILGAAWVLDRIGSFFADIIMLFFLETSANLKGDTLFR